MKWNITREQHGMLIRTFLKEIASFSKRLLIKAKSMSGQILVNGAPQTVRYILQEGDVLTVILPKETIAPRMQKENLPLDIVYEDDYLLVVNKPAGIATIPSTNHPSGTIANRLLYYYETKSLPYTVHIVTRLDRDTSGLVLIAKHQYSHSRLSVLQKENAIKRQYKAFVMGHLENAFGTIHQPIDRKPGSIIQRAVVANGKRAITHFHVEKKFRDYTFVQLQLETGRTHQIRVHMAYLGHPLLGDDLYDGISPYIQRQALHCNKITFVHPFTKELKVFQALLPQDMVRLSSQV